MLSEEQEAQDVEIALTANAQEAEDGEVVQTANAQEAEDVEAAQTINAEESNFRKYCCYVWTYSFEITIVTCLFLTIFWFPFLFIGILLFVIYFFYHRIANIFPSCQCCTCCGIFLFIFIWMIILALFDTSTTKGPSHFKTFADFTLVTLFWFWFIALLLDLFIYLPCKMYEHMYTTEIIGDFYDISKIAVSILLGIVMGIVCIILGTMGPEVVEVNVRLNNLPLEMTGFTIVALPDFHVGRGVGTDNLNEIIPKVNELQPDLIALVGDVTDSSYDK